MGTTFFAYSVLTQQNSWQSTLRYTIILIGALLIIAYLLYFLRHKRSNKYRDLLVLVALVELLTIGIQVRDLQASRTANADSQAVATLLRSVATQKHVATRIDGGIHTQHPSALCQQQYCSHRHADHHRPLHKRNVHRHN